MTARAFIILALVAVASKAQAAAVLHGVVLANELSGSPMGKVEVSVDGANANNTGADRKIYIHLSQ
jgi:hypothetical protein